MMIVRLVRMDQAGGGGVRLGEAMFACLLPIGKSPSVTWFEHGRLEESENVENVLPVNAFSAFP